MPLTVNELRRISANERTYSKGAAYFRQGRVHLEEEERRGDGAHVVAARIEGGEGAEYVTGLTITPDGGHLEEYYCTCPAFARYDGICKHLVALALTVSQSGPPSRPQLGSGPGVLQLLRQYAQQNMEQVPPPVTGLTLEPTLLLSRSVPAVSFRVGRERLYVVKDLGQLVADVRAGETRSYGKGLTFLHSLGAFDGPSGRLVEFLLTYYNKNNSMYDESFHYYGHDRARIMLLPPFMLEALLDLCVGSKLTVETSRDRRVLSVREGNPKLGLHIDREGDGSYAMELSESVLVLRGARRLFLGVGHALYRCDPPFSRAIGPLVELAGQRLGMPLGVGEADMPVLAATLLPQLEPHMQLVSNCDLTVFQPPRRQSQVYLDLDGEGLVSARVEHHYGDSWHHGFEEENLRKVLDPVGERQVENLLMRYLPQAGGPGQVCTQGEEGLLELVGHGMAELAEVAQVFASDSFRSVHIKPPVGVSVGVRLESGLLRLHFDMEGLDLAELEEVLASYRLAKKYHRLSDGSFLSLTDGPLAEFSALAQGLDLKAEDVLAGELPVAKYRALYLDSLLRESGRLQYVRDGAFKRMIRDVREVRDADFPIPESLRQVLRNYQKTGYRWLRTLAGYGFGGILADDMGLGKTIQVVALLLAQKEEAPAQSLVVCPASLVLNWESEVRRFAPALSVVPVVGSAPEREWLLEHAQGADLLITSYDLLKRDIQHYSQMEFRYLVADESQYMKNQKTQSAKAVKSLRSEVRFALSGTPVENSLAELWSVFDFLMPGYLYHYAAFRKRFEVPITRYGDEYAAADLRRLVSPFLLRRMKADVLKELPPKIEVVRYAELGEEQKKLYVASATLARRELESGEWEAGGGRIQILAQITRLRQLCCDPALVYENYHEGSAKLELCMELLEECRSSGHRVLLFSQFTSMLRRIARRLDEEDIPYSTITGETPSSRRLELVNDFNRGDTPVFLISLKAGGTGLNLTGADVVIHYDPWWNSSAQNQATDRAHRIGQTRTVQVYKLIAKDTLEERILEMQKAKAQLAEQIVRDGDGGLAKLSKGELLALFE